MASLTRGRYFMLMLLDKVKECSKCGVCRSACPVFLELNDEVMSPRGRISLIEALLEGKLSHSERFIDTVRTCIRCMRCSDVCPSGVRVEEIIQSARNSIAENIGMPDIAGEIFRATLLDPAAFHASLASADPGPDRSGLPLWLLPLFFHEGARLPELAEETALDKYPEYTSSGGKKRISLMLGCSINYAHTSIADSAIEVLKKLEVDIFLPKDQLCCGMPALFFGDVDAARELARRNLKALRAGEFDAVITLCPACGVTLKREYNWMLGGDIEEFTSKVYDISQFIVIFTDYRGHQADISVTYHDPCYLRIGQGVSAEPRQILKSRTRFVEMKDADKCCGLGCTMGIFHPEVSIKMGEVKINSIMESGADMVATGCPGCIMFLQEQLDKRGANKEVMHTIQILQKNI